MMLDVQVTPHRGDSGLVAPVGRDHAAWYSRVITLEQAVVST